MKRAPYANSTAPTTSNYDWLHNGVPHSRLNGFVPTRIDPLPQEFPGAHAMGTEEDEAVARVCASHSLYRYYGLNPQHEADQFEEEFAAFLGARYAVAVTSGTAALHVALSALRVGPGQEVIVPAYLWVSVVAAVVNLGAIPVLAEIDTTFGLNADDVRGRITPRTAGIIAVHMSGAPIDIVPLVSLAREKGLFLVEDAAQCVGGSIHGQRVGTFGDIGIFSFQLNKNMSAGEGGAVVTNNEAIYRRCVAAQDVGYARDGSGQVVMDDIAAASWGRGYRMDELRAAILRVQLRKLPSIIEHMRTSKEHILATISRHEGLELRRRVDPAGDTGGFLLMLFEGLQTAYRVNQRLRRHGILCSSAASSNTLLSEYGMHIYSNIPALVQKVGTDHRGAPWSLKENAESRYEYGYGSCPNSDELFGRTVLLTVPANLTLNDEDDILMAFDEVLDWELLKTINGMLI